MPQYIILPCLDHWMKKAEATNLALAEVTGITERTINNARCGRPVYKFHADCIIYALQSKKFNYKKRGPKT